MLERRRRGTAPYGSERGPDCGGTLSPSSGLVALTALSLAMSDSDIGRSGRIIFPRPSRLQQALREKSFEIGGPGRRESMWRGKLRCQLRQVAKTRRDRLTSLELVFELRELETQP